MAHKIAAITPNNTAEMAKVEQLLQKEGIQRDKNLDYTCAIYDDNDNIIATGSCFGSTLRCIAIDSAHRGQGLLGKLIPHLQQVQRDRGHSHLFLYTKSTAAPKFQRLGFHEIARVDDKIVFMENSESGFADYLAKLKFEDYMTRQEKNLPQDGRVAALVVNANPFTLGHLYLVEKVARENDVLHLFIVNEEMSLIPFAVRERLVKEGTAHLNNIVYHDSGAYMISSATFPSYFLKDEASVIENHARLDLAIFRKIAATLGVNRRYVGDEPTSFVTNLYNQVMKQELPKGGVECVIVPRKQEGGRAISASIVRTCIKEDRIDDMANLVPPTTYAFFKSAEAEPIIQRIRQADDVVHY